MESCLGYWSTDPGEQSDCELVEAAGEVRRPWVRRHG
jgi:hypothetical protein